MKKKLTLIPIVMFSLFITIRLIPYGFSIMSEPYHPWYTPYTSVVFIFLVIVYFPVTMLFKILGLDILGIEYMLAVFIYSIFLSLMIHLGVSALSQSKKKA